MIGREASATARVVPDVVGQDDLQSFFAHAIDFGRVSHAYLLTGPRGVGKAMFAQGLARALLCSRAAPAACGACSSCRMLASNNHPAFARIAPEPGRTIEIDAIRGVIGELARREAGRRVVIIDDADRMPAPAANALLKTLEEPPPGVVFLIVTSVPAKLLPTIISRCHRAVFRTLTHEACEQVLEEHSIAPELRDDLTRASGGSPGRAIEIAHWIDEAGGIDRWHALLEGSGSDRPDTLIEFCPPQGKESKRDRTRRLLELTLAGLFRRRLDAADDEPARRGLLERANAIDTLIGDVDGNANPDLVLERLARVLRPSGSAGPR